MNETESKALAGALDRIHDKLNELEARIKKLEQRAKKIQGEDK